MFEFLISQKDTFGLSAVIYPDEMTLWDHVVTWLLDAFYKKRAREYYELLRLRKDVVRLTEDSKNYHRKLNNAMRALNHIQLNALLETNSWDASLLNGAQELDGVTTGKESMFLNTSDDAFSKMKPSL